MQKHSSSFLLLLATLALTIAAIIVTTIINRTSTTGQEATDIRAKAGATSTLRMRATVDHTNPQVGTFTVNKLEFTEGEQNLPGEWEVSPPPGFDLSSLRPGTFITFTVDPSTMRVDTHTVRATNIVIE